MCGTAGEGRAAGAWGRIKTIKTKNPLHAKKTLTYNGYYDIINCFYMFAIGWRIPSQANRSITELKSNGKSKFFKTDNKPGRIAKPEHFYEVERD